MRIAEIVAVVFGLFLGITAFSAGQGLVGSLILVVAVLLLFFGQERKGPVYLRPWIKKCFRKKPKASVDQVPEKHTAHQPAAVPDISQPMQKACSAEKKTELVREPIHKKPNASVDQVPEKHTAHQPAAVPDISQPMQKACSAEKKTELVREPIRKKPNASVDQVPEKHTAHQPAAVPDVSQPMQKACSAEKKTELVREPIHKKPNASVDQVPEKHTAHQPAAVPDISQPMQKACSAEKKTELVRDPIHQKNSIPCTPSKSAEPFEDKESGITYQLKSDGTAEVTYCSGWQSSKTIPETISGYRVTSIGANAFPKGNCCSLSVPASVTEIKSLPKGFYEQRWDRPRFDLRENAMDIDELVLVTNYYDVQIIVKPGSFAEQYCRNNNIRHVVK